MIEPTDEMRAVYVAAYDERLDSDEVMEARLAGLLDVIERDYVVSLRPSREREVAAEGGAS